MEHWLQVKQLFVKNGRSSHTLYRRDPQAPFPPGWFYSLRLGFLLCKPGLSTRPPPRADASTDCHQGGEELGTLRKRSVLPPGNVLWLPETAPQSPGSWARGRSLRRPAFRRARGFAARPCSWGRPSPPPPGLWASRPRLPGRLRPTSQAGPAPGPAQAPPLAAFRVDLRRRGRLA